MTKDPEQAVNHPGHPTFHEHFVISEVPPTDENIGASGVHTLGQVIEMYGRQGALPSPETGRLARFTLEAWKDHDPDSTYLRLEFTHVDPAKVGTKLPVEARPASTPRKSVVKRVEFDVG